METKKTKARAKGPPKKTTKKRVGRPPKIDAAVLEKLEYAFTVGATNEQACDYADINAATLYRYKAGNDELCEKIEHWKHRTKFRAKVNVSKAIGEGDLDVSKWYLEKTDDAFKPKMRQEVTGKDGGAINIAFKWEDE